MTTFKEYLNEVENKTFDVEEAAKYVLKNCKKFLDEIGYLQDLSVKGGYDFSPPAMYRGLMGFDTDQIHLLDGERRRKPVDSTMQLTKTLDSYFKEKFGYPYRTKGLFCSGAKTTAESYGHVYAIFPTDDYEYVWSTDITDAYLDLENTKNYEKPILLWTIKNDLKRKDFNLFLMGEYAKKSDKKKSWDEWYKMVSEWLRLKNPYQDTGLRLAAVGDGTEVMMHCKSYIAVPMGRIKDFNNTLVILKRNKNEES